MSKSMHEGHATHWLTIMYITKEMRKGHTQRWQIIVLAKGDGGRQCITLDDICIGKSRRRKVTPDVTLPFL